MTVSSPSSRVVYAGNGSTTVFPFAFKVAQPADLVVVYTDATGDDVILSPFQYGASGFGQEAGGSVTYPTPASGDPPIAAGTRLTIRRDVPLTQPTSISNQGAMWPVVIEAALDRLTWIAQNLQDQLDRTFRVSESEQGTLGLLPSAEGRADSVLGFDGDGQPYAATLTGELVSVATWLVVNFFPAGTSAADAAAAIGAAYKPGDNLFEGDNAFIGDNDFTVGVTDFTGGRITVPTRTAGDDGTDAASTAFVKVKAESTVGGAVLRGYLAGLGLGNNASVPTTRIDVAAGVCADDTNAVMMTSAGELLVCTATGADGLDSGSLANNTWYHVFLIGKADGLVASFASTSLAPTLPATFLYKRRIGSFKTDGSAQILAFRQDGDTFQWDAPVAYASSANPGTAAITVATGAPTGVRSEAILQLVPTNVSSGGPAYLLVSDVAVADAAPGAAASDVGSVASAAAAAIVSATVKRVFTNTAAQVRVRLSFSDASTTMKMNTLGWVDRRGRDS